ncbi:putative membrane protein [Arthrobacter sp. 2762]
MSNSDSYPKPSTGVPGGLRQPSGSPQAGTPARPQQRPGTGSAGAGATGARPATATNSAQRPAGAPGQRPASAGQRPAGAPGQRPAQPGQRPAGAPGQRPAQGGPGLVKPAPKAKVRRARLLVSKVDPWSVLKMAFLLSVALGIVTVVAAIVLWTVLDLTGIFNQVDSLLGTLAGSEGSGFELKKIASLGQVASFATIIAVVNVVLLTALSMLSAVLYNISATLVGGIGVTLTDD